MKIVFIGTPDYACIPMEALIKAGHELQLVISTPDKPKNRGKMLMPSPVKQRASELGIEVITPEKIKNNTELLETLFKLEPDFIVVYAYGKILPKALLELPKYECINIHASLLPKYRGAAPIHRALMDGEEYTGITIMRMEEGLDTGAVYIQEKTETGRKTSADLYRELSEIGSRLVCEALPKIASGELKPTPQTDEGSCYASMVFKEEGEINWSDSAINIDRLVRAFNDFPVAWTRKDGEPLKIYYTEIGSGKGRPGEVISCGKQGIEVACGDGSVIIKTLQAPGKKTMDAAAYLLGNKLEISSFLG